jgi:hypothetical protein
VTSSRTFSALAAALALALVLAEPARAQMLGAPVLQNAFTNSGFTLGADFGSGDHKQSYGGAVAWSPATGIFQLDAGVAYLHSTNASGTATYGARLMVPVLSRSSAFGVAPFAGMGGANFSGINDWQIPLGVAVGYRRAFGANGRGVSAYVSPFYSWARVRQDQQTVTHGLFRVSLGVDAAVSQSVGVTVGYETGAKAGEGQPGATGGIFGLGVSYALNHGKQAAKSPPPRPVAVPDSTPPPPSTP